MSDVLHIPPLDLEALRNTIAGKRTIGESIELNLALLVQTLWTHVYPSEKPFAFREAVTATPNEVSALLDDPAGMQKRLFSLAINMLVDMRHLANLLGPNVWNDLVTDTNIILEQERRTLKSHDETLQLSAIVDYLARANGLQSRNKSVPVYQRATIDLNAFGDEP